MDPEIAPSKEPCEDAHLAVGTLWPYVNDPCDNIFDISSDDDLRVHLAVYRADQHTRTNRREAIVCCNVKDLKHITTLNDMISDLGAGDDDSPPIQIQNTKATAEMLIQIIKWYRANPELADADTKHALLPHEIEFIECLTAKKIDLLFDLILVANFLNAKTIMYMSCNYVANLIKGKTPSEIRQTFGLTKELVANDKEIAIRD